MKHSAVCLTLQKATIKLYMNLKKSILISISTLAIAFVIYKIFTFSDWHFFLNYSDRKLEFLFIIIIQILLLFVSLLIEALKWQILISPLKKINLKDAFYQILKGIQGGLISPARLGDPPARVVTLPKEIRLFAIANSFVGSFIQNIVIGIGAIIGLMTLNNSYFENINAQFIKYFLITIVFVGVMLLILMRLSKKNNLLAKINPYLQKLKEFKKSDIFLIFIYSLIKYLIFCSQLFVLLHFLEVVSIADIQLITIYFGIITILPSFAIADLGIRGSIALFVFGTTSANSMAILISIFLLWIINLALPAFMPLFWKSKLPLN